MNDFLSALLERSNERAPVLCPRRLSRFEPAGLGAAEEIGVISEEHVTPARRDAAPRIETPAVVRPTPLVAEPSVSPPEARREAPFSVAAESSREAVSPTVVPQREADRKPAVKPMLSSDPAPNTPVPQLVIREEKTLRTTVRHTSERQTIERRRDPANLVNDGLSRRSSDVLRPAASVVAKPTQSRRAERTTQPTPAPTIHVSIGRIEIRAHQAPPAAPSRPAKSAGPKLDLDQYLAARNGSGR